MVRYWISLELVSSLRWSDKDFKELATAFLTGSAEEEESFAISGFWLLSFFVFFVDGAASGLGSASAKTRLLHVTIGMIKSLVFLVLFQVRLKLL